jgi:hypothetical protein
VSSSVRSFRRYLALSLPSHWLIALCKSCDRFVFIGRRFTVYFFLLVHVATNIQIINKLSPYTVYLLLFCIRRHMCTNFFMCDTDANQSLSKKTRTRYVRDPKKRFEASCGGRMCARRCKDMTVVSAERTQ